MAQHAGEPPNAPPPSASRSSSREQATEQKPRLSPSEAERATVAGSAVDGVEAEEVKPVIAELQQPFANGVASHSAQPTPRSNSSASTPSPTPSVSTAPHSPVLPSSANAATSSAAAARSPGRPHSPSTGFGCEGRTISCEDIQLVQNLIERCLQLYMNQREVISTLQYQAKIEPGFTSLVWSKLEEQNPDFFQAYYTRLRVKEQMQAFNKLLEEHHQLLHKMRLAPPAPVHGAPLGYPIHRPPGMGPPAVPMVTHGRLPHGPVGGPYGMHPHVRGSTSLRDVPALGVPSTAMHKATAPSLHASEQDGYHADNGGEIIREVAGREERVGGDGNAAFPFGQADLGLGLHPSMSMPMLDGAGAPASLAMAAQDGMPVPEPHHASREVLGSLGHLPRNFSLSDLAAEFPTGPHLDGSATGEPGPGSSPPYHGHDTEAYLRSPDKEDDKVLGLEPLPMQILGDGDDVKDLLLPLLPNEDPPDLLQSPTAEHG